MRSRRNPPAQQSLSPYDSSPTASAGPPSAAFPRSASPSGITQLLSKPVKWFSRNQGTRPRAPSGSSEPRSSTSSYVRKPKISQPTDPRPFLPSALSEPYLQVSPQGPSRSVHDLSLTRTQTAVDSPRQNPQSPGSPSRRKQPAAGLGDLRALSHKPWSRSAEELGKFSVSAPSSPATATFQDKVSQYRSGSAGHTPSTSSGQQYLFPIITSQGVPPSSPGSTPGSMSPLVTAVAGSPPSSPTNTHLHVRSHSFTPKLPSKLSSSKLGPSSPTRKMSGSSDKEMPPPNPKERDRIGHGGRGAFPFAFGAQRGSPASDSPLALPAGESPLLPPPTIIEPTKTADVQDIADNKRVSQITFHSGFVNRLMDFTAPSAHGPSYAYALPSSSKSWKPFKLILRGTKLQFYKPPSDRTAAVKDLFPVGIVALQEENENAEADVKGDCSPAADEVKPTSSRRKRAFWGRKTHPDLALDNQRRVEKGTLEALVHEAVFATTFSDALPREPGSIGKSGWEDFALSVLFGLPTAVGRSKFETEFVRFGSFLVSGSEDNRKEQDRARVKWLAAEYLRYYGAPADAIAWEGFREETIPDFISPPPRGFPVTVSTQAIHTASPLLGVESPSVSLASPNLGTFSPRPEADSYAASIQERILGPRSAQSFAVSPSNPSKSRSGAPRDGLWSILEREGFTKHVLVRLMPQEVAHSLYIFNAGLLAAMPDNLTVEDCLGPSGETARRPSDLHIDESSSRPSPSILQPFAGSDAHPHWLTKLILLHVLGPDSSYNASRQSGRFSVDLSQAPQPTSQPTSRTYSRSEVITAWARVGELCRLAGDECSWRAIFAALCCRPLARLEKAWKRVDSAALSMVEGWVAREESEAMERKLTPWAGSTLEDIREAIQKAMSGDEQPVWMPRFLKEGKDAFEAFRTDFSLCSRKAEPPTEEDLEDVPKLIAAWKELSATGGGVGNIASQFVHTDQFMSLSVAAESRRKGHYEPIFWSRASSFTTPANQCLVPLLFPEPLPTISLVDRTQFLRPRVDSEPTRLNVQDIQNLRNPEVGLLPLTTKRRRSFGAENRDGLHALDFGGTVIPLFDNELLLLVQPGSESPSRPSSRPPSRPVSRPPSMLVDTMTTMTLDKPVARAPSIRVRPATASRPGSSHGGLDRKPSLARRNSLPSISQRTSLVISEHSNERPVRVIVQAGTLERLVNVLAHGLPGVSVSIADDNGEMPLRDKRTRDVKLDRAEFASVWWDVFRSFVSPLVFFELLRKHYVSISKPTPPRVDDLVNLAAQRCDILEVILDWLHSGGTQDVLNDGALFHAVQSFLGSKEDHTMPASLDKDEDRVVESWAIFQQRLKAAQSFFKSQTLRPTARSSPVADVLGLSGQSSRSAEPPDLSKTTPDELVDSIDAMVAAAMRNISEEDLFITADLLEVQTSDRLGWFIPWEPSHNSDETEIQNIYSHLAEVPPSSTGFELAQDELYRLFPPAIRSSLRAHHVLRKWVVSQLVAPRIGIQARQGRMELLLQALEICRQRSEAETSPVLYTQRRCVRTFAELVLTSAVLSPESRAHARAWTNVANTRGVSSDSLMAYLSKPVRPAAPMGTPLVTDLGWLLERVLEVLSLPDVYDSGSDVGRVINFEKRRYLSNLLVDTQPRPSARTRSRRDISRNDLERLSHIEQQLSNVHLDLRAIREEAHRESATVPAAGVAKRAQRPFQRLVHMQMEKNKRDRTLYDRFNKERKQEQHRTDKRDDYLNKAMHARRPSTALQKQHRMKKSGSVTFFQQLMRPISSALSLDNVDAIVDKRTAAELDFMPTGKPVLALNVVDARVAQFVNYHRPYTFQVDTEDGGHYLLQATTKAEMNKWIRTLEHVSKTAAQRRLTWLGNSPKPQLSDHIHDSNITPSRDPRAVFGVDLDVLLKRETGGALPPPGTIPSVIERCLREVESRGLGEVGIYRIAGANSEVNSLKDALNRGLWPITSSTDIYAVCDLIKTWFRVLPEPVFPSYSYHDVTNAMRIDDLNARMDRIRVVVQALPRPNFDVLKRIIEHLDKVTDFEEQNQMTSDALAIVFSPNLLRAPHNDFLMIMANMPQTNKLVKMLVTHFHTIFDEVDADAEAEPEDDDADDDLIPEEDEDEDEDEGVPSNPDLSASTSYPAHEYPSAR